MLVLRRIRNNGFTPYNGIPAFRGAKRITEMNVYVIPGLTNEVEQAASQVWGVPVEAIKQRSRKRELLEPRQVSMWWRVRHTRDSLSRIGELLGGYNHSTVINACNQVSNLLETNKQFREMVRMVLKIMAANRKNKRKALRHDNGI